MFSTMERYIIVVGKTCQGKTATIKSLKHHSEVQSDDEIVPDSCSVKETKIVFAGKSYCLLDTPSFFDPDWYIEKSKLSKESYKIVDPEEPHLKVLEQIQDTFEKINGRTSVVLFVIKGTERFTRESKDTISVMKRYFGDALIDRTIFVLTNADESRSGSFDKVRDVIRAHLGVIGYHGELNDCFVDFDNSSNPVSQLDILLHKVETIISSGDPYSMTDFNNAQNALKEEKRILHETKEKEMQKRLDEEKRIVEEEYSRDMERMKEKLAQKQLECDILVEESKSNDLKFAIKDVSANSIPQSGNRPDIQVHERRLDVGKSERSNDPRDIHSPKASFTVSPVVGEINFVTDAGNKPATIPKQATCTTGAFGGYPRLAYPAPVAKSAHDTHSSTPTNPDSDNDKIISSEELGAGATNKISGYDYPRFRADTSNPSYCNDNINSLSGTNPIRFGTNQQAIDSHLSIYQTPITTAKKFQEMEDNLYARGLAIEERNNQLKQLKDDIKRLNEEPPQIVHHHYEPEEESFIETAVNVGKTIKSGFTNIFSKPISKSKKEPG